MRSNALITNTGRCDRRFVGMVSRNGIFVCIIVIALGESRGADDSIPNYLQHQKPSNDAFMTSNLSKTLMISDELNLTLTDLKEGHSIDPRFHDVDFMSDDPFVFDLEPYQEQGRLAVPSLINIWNELVFNQPHGSELGETIAGRTAGAGCQTQCHPLASCKNGKCVCNSGLAGDGIRTCEDVDECKSPETCKLHEECLNLFSSFDCRCMKGFQSVAKGSPCLDVNECNAGSHTCSKSANCTNTEGSFTCTCPPGNMMTQSGECRIAKLDPILECKPDKIVIKVTKNHLSYFDPARKALAMNPNTSHLLYLMNNKTAPVLKECTLLPSVIDGNITYLISIPFASCSTERLIVRTSNFTSVHYKNTLWWSSFFKDLSFILMPYKMYDIDCTFSEDKTPITINTSSVVQNVSRTVEQLGRANITMRFWRFLPGLPLSEPSLAVPLEYVIGDVLYVTVELQQGLPVADSNPFLRMDNCYLSSASSSAKVDIITNGCISPDPSFKHQIITNGESPIGCFLFQMMQLQPPGGMFVKCDATLCKNICRPMCHQGRRRRSLNETLGENQVRIAIGNVQFTGGPITPVQPAKKAVETQEKSSKDKSKKKEDKPTSPPDSAAKEQDVTYNFVLPIMLIVANLSLLIILGLISYALARSVASNRRSKRQKRHRDGLLDETVGYVSFSPPTPLVTSGVDSGVKVSRSKFEHSHSFCQDKDCQFMKDLKSKSHRGLNKNSRKKRQQMKESVFKPVVYDTSTLTCPTPFNSPPPSPTELPSVKSVGTSPIRLPGGDANL